MHAYIYTVHTNISYTVRAGILTLIAYTFAVATDYCMMVLLVRHIIKSMPRSSNTIKENPVTYIFNVPHF